MTGTRRNRWTKYRAKKKAEELDKLLRWLRSVETGADSTYEESPARHLLSLAGWTDDAITIDPHTPEGRRRYGWYEGYHAALTAFQAGDPSIPGLLDPQPKKPRPKGRRRARTLSIYFPTF